MNIDRETAPGFDVAPSDRPDLLVPEKIGVALGRCAAMRLLPSMGVHLTLYRASIRGDREAEARFASYESALGAGRHLGLIVAKRWEREHSGRIRFLNPGTQQIANDLRYHIAPSLGCVYLDCDYTTAHVWIAAARSGDRALLTALAGGDLYKQIAAWLAPDADPKRMRKAVKRSVLALLNGGGLHTVARNLRAVVGAARAEGLAFSLIAEWWCTFPDLWRYCTAVQSFAVQNRLMEQVPVPTLTGRIAMIPLKSKGNDGWKTLLSAAWSSVEADAMDLVLGRLHGTIGDLDGRLVQPMFDGVLVECPVRNASVAAARMRALMSWAIAAVGVPGVGVDIEILERWGAEVALSPR